VELPASVLRSASYELEVRADAELVAAYVIAVVRRWTDRPHDHASAPR
jgi:hypothetical protein